MTAFDSFDISTRPNRRRAVSIIAAQLTRIRSAELAFLYRMPANLHDSEAVAAADDSIDVLNDVIDLLEDAY